MSCLGRGIVSLNDDLFVELMIDREEYVHFAEVCFRNFADRVKYWMTFNEVNLYAEFAYERAVFPPLRCSPPFGDCASGNSDVEPLIVVHNMLLAHARAAKLYRESFKVINNC